MTEYMINLLKEHGNLELTIKIRDYTTIVLSMTDYGSMWITSKLIDIETAKKTKLGIDFILDKAVESMWEELRKER